MEYQEAELSKLFLFRIIRSFRQFLICTSKEHIYGNNKDGYLLSDIHNM